MGSWDAGSTRRWRRVRTRVLERDRYRCRAHADGWCARSRAGPHQCTGVATHAHHTHGRGVTGDDPAFIVASCATCNLAIGDPTMSAEPKIKRITKW